MPAGEPHKLWVNIEESATRQVTTTGAPVLPNMFYPQVITFSDLRIINRILFQSKTKNTTNKNLKILAVFRLNFTIAMIEMASSFYIAKLEKRTINIDLQFRVTITSQFKEEMQNYDKMKWK